jgi:hypothetical protein
MVTCCDPPAAIVPLVQLGKKIVSNPLVMLIPLTVSVEFPLFVMVSVAVALCPTVKFPNAKFPLSPTIRVGVDEDGDVGVVLPAHAHAEMRRRTTQPRLNISQFSQLVKAARAKTTPTRIRFIENITPYWLRERSLEWLPG